MRIVSQSRLRDFADRHPETEAGLALWLAVARKATWTGMNDVQARWPKSKVLNGERVRFEIAGGNYRLIVAIQFHAQIIWVKFIGTHAQYDRINPFTVDQF
ncbi:MAG: type II toxin-antitoxin system HigB family toxin [Caulobacteraceae bacterium]